MVLKLLVFMAAVAVMEGVAGLQEKQLANGTQSKVNLGHKKTQRGRRLDKLACIIFHGRCQTLDDNCDGQLEQGPEWCLHSRHFGCCIPRSCCLNGAIYRHGAITVDRCIELICENGELVYYGWSTGCDVCYTLGTTTISPYVNRMYNVSSYEGAFVFSQYSFLSHAPFGIDITLVSIGQNQNCVECILYWEPGSTVEICFYSYDTYPWVCVNTWCYDPIPQFGIAVTISPGPIYIIFMPYGIYILGSQGLGAYVDWDPFSPWCPLNVYAFATTSLYTELYGLCDVWIKVPPYPTDYTMLNGGVTTSITDFIGSWQHRLRRKHDKKRTRKIGQVTEQPIIERSMSVIEELCEEMNKGPCTILSSEECEKLMENCVSRISSVSKPGHGGFIDSSE